MGKIAKITVNKPEATRGKTVSRTRKKEGFKTASSSVDQVLQLQRSIGNRAVQKLVKSGIIQKKLNISQPHSQVPRIQRQCTRAAGTAIFNLYASGIGSGHSYIRQGARIDFSNWDNKSHTITIVPYGIFTSRSVTINPGGRAIMWAARTSVERSGTILDNVPRGRSVHDITVCP